MYGQIRRILFPIAFLVVIACAWLFIGSKAISAGPPDILRAGIAKKDITPTKPVMLGGYASRKNLSQGVHDPLSARVVAFEQNGKRLVLVSTDILGFYGGTTASMRKAITSACKLEPSELFLSAIHTHSGPIISQDSEKIHPNNAEYTKTLETLLIAVIHEALAHPAAVSLAVRSGFSPVGVNRREIVQDAAGKTRIQLGRNPFVMTDKEVQVLRISRADKAEALAVVFAYATHSTSLGPGNYLISGDVHGLAEQFVEKHLDNKVIVPGFAGASGNIDPWFRVLPSFNTKNAWLPEPVLLGTMLGEEVVHVLNGMKKPVASGPVKTAFKTLLLPRKPKDEKTPTTNDTPAELNITVGRVGEVAFVGLGGEIFNEIGKAIKTSSPFPNTFVITHCNGTAGYLPTKEAYPAGGYEVNITPFAPMAAEQTIQEIVQMLKQL